MSSKVLKFNEKDMEVINYRGKLLFNPKNFAECVGLQDSSIKQKIAKMDKTQVVKLKYGAKGIGNRTISRSGENFLTETGVNDIINRSNKIKDTSFIDWINNVVKNEMGIKNKKDEESLQEKAKVESSDDKDENKVMENGQEALNNMMLFEGHKVEVFNYNGLVLFNPYHCGECLELADSSIRDAVRKMNDKQVVKLKNSDVVNSNIRKLNNAGENFLTESGVYKLIFKSRKESAERFQDWVTDEVLPTIRKTGGYVQDNQEEKFVNSYFSSLGDETKLALMDVLKNENEKMRPKAKAYDDLMDSYGYVSMLDIGKITGVGRNKLFHFLREQKILVKQGNSNVPYEKYIDSGYFRVTSARIATGEFVPVTLVSIKGLDLIYKTILAKGNDYNFKVKPLYNMIRDLKRKKNVCA